jgi:hypothetical protein
VDSEENRLPGILRRGALTATRDTGVGRVTPSIDIAALRRRHASVPAVGAASMEASASARNGLSRAWTFLSRAVRAVAEHLRHNWLDGVLAVGFVAVFLLSAYVLLKG